MPTAVDRLTKQSEMSQVRAAISACIAYCVKNEGLDQSQAAGKCYGMARQKTGKSLGRK